MTTKFGPEDKTKAILSLFRVRAAESTPDADGLKTVWHQGTKGADLLSYVNGKGQVVRQEFTLLHECFIWSPDRGLSTGWIRSGGGSQAHEASDEVKLDQVLSVERILSGNEALATYDGQDKYILHMAKVLTLAVEGMSLSNPATVTAVHLPPATDPSKSSASAFEAAAGKPDSKLPMILGAAILLVGGLALAAYAFL